MLAEIELRTPIAGITMYDEIDDALYAWYKWADGYHEVRGHSGADPTCRDFRASRQWMDYNDLNDLVDYQLQKTKGELIDPLIQKLGLRHRVAINTAMRNMECGGSVWSSNRNPDTQEDDYREAKELLRPKLASMGLVNRKEV
ncbi:MULTISPECIES: hypothetical protein [Burkholderia]|uniref:Uncharacterized protein n=1 Tax=Burkholderia pyrrocinia TaxID=60550 RepID=A0A318JBB5_BURPY|nr:MULTISPECIES: hypothetical protein [Burkholderia]PXX41098.1 hypothetical protein NA66_1001708 [Burkholderia pyrrocinia]SFW58244.1 hypothetical protein SAMN03159384_03025 [Burkholderia sp. NFACC33-1]SFY11484.1 hypothetical protein SAMN03159408_03237 [Burkholderia sp. NFPP32]